MTVSSFRARERCAVNGADPRALDVVDGVYYPSSDGKPMAENVVQWRAVLADGSVLDYRFKERPDVLVAGDVLVYPQQGDTRTSLAPDLLVAFDVPKMPHRRSYKVWVEGKAPDFVMEVASKATWKDDRGCKKAAYAKMGVREYWLFDPTGEFFDPPLEGFRLQGGKYLPLAARRPQRALPSKVLGLELRPDDGHVRFHDPATGEDLRTHSEEADGRKREAAGRKREAAGRRKAEAKVAQLEALLRQQRGQGAP